jgi:Xaa-Pro aminopeptidase
MRHSFGSVRRCAPAFALAVALTASALGAQPDAAPRTRPVPAPGSASTAPIATLRIGVSEYAERRAAVGATVPDGVILALGAHEPREDYVAFYQAPHFQYLTGVREPDAALIGVKSGGQLTWTLFVPPRDPAREVWTGRRVGPQAALSEWGLPGRPAGDLQGVLEHR